MCLGSRSTGWRTWELITSSSAPMAAARFTVSFASGTDGDIKQVNVQKPGWHWPSPSLHRGRCAIRRWWSTRACQLRFCWCTTSAATMQ